MKLPTFSAIERADACPPSVSLPQAASSSPFAARGTAIHAYLADPCHDLDAVPEEHRAACAAIQLDRIPAGVEWAHEVTLCYDPETDTGRELGRDLGRDYSGARPTEYVGTLDVIGLTPDAAVVYDFKSGHGSVTSAAENMQLRVGALAACRAYGRDKAIVGIVYLRDEEPVFDVAELDSLEIEITAAQLRRLTRKLSSEQPPTEGEWCRYCPAIAHCPPKVSLLRAACGEPESLSFAITPENAAKAYAAWKRADDVLGSLKKALVAFAESTPIDLGGGKVYGPKASTSEKLDPLVVEAVLTKLYGPEVARQAVELKATKASVERATGKKKEPLEAIRAAGGATTTSTVRVCEHAGSGR